MKLGGSFEPPDQSVESPLVVVGFFFFFGVWWLWVILMGCGGLQWLRADFGGCGYSSEWWLVEFGFLDTVVGG